MKTPEEIAATLTVDPMEVAMMVDAINADRAQIWGVLREENPILTAWLGNHMHPDDDPETTATVDELWLQYIDHDLIGFDYTRREALAARLFITNGVSRWRG